MVGDWIKLHRKLLESAVASDPIVGWVWVNLLLRANWEKRQLMDGTWLEPGQLVIGRERFSEEVGLTVKQVRRALDSLRKCQNIVIKGARRGTTVTICNWRTYQGYDSTEGPEKGPERGQKRARKGPENKKLRKEELKNPTTWGKARPRTVDDVKTFWTEKELNGDPASSWDHFESNGWRVGGRAAMKDWRAAARNWSRRQFKDNGQPQGTLDFLKQMEFDDEGNRIS